MVEKARLKNQTTKALFEAILSLENMEECDTFFEDLCTMKELADMAQRLEAAKMLLDGKTYEQIVREVEITIKYQGYIDRQLRQVAEMKKLEDRPLPPDLDYEAIGGLRLEARQKLAQIRPRNLGQASRVSGVSPADVAVLMVYLGK